MELLTGGSRCETKIILSYYLVCRSEMYVGYMGAFKKLVAFTEYKPFKYQDLSLAVPPYYSSPLIYQFLSYDIQQLASILNLSPKLIHSILCEIIHERTKPTEEPELFRYPSTAQLSQEIPATEATGNTEFDI